MLVQNAKLGHPEGKNESIKKGRMMGELGPQGYLSGRFPKKNTKEEKEARKECSRSSIQGRLTKRQRKRHNQGPAKSKN